MAGGLGERWPDGAAGTRVGAVTGAVVSKHKKGQGAIIGGAAGAILGAGVGSTIDEKKKTSGQ